jgi:serine protease Do
MTRSRRPVTRSKARYALSLDISARFACLSAAISTIPPPCQTENSTTLQSLSTSLAELAQKVRPSVVQVRTVGYGAAEGQEAGLVASQHGTGSGVILDSSGFTITNAHVVKGARHIDIWLNEANMQANTGTTRLPTQRSVPASLVGTDTEMDLAVLKIDRTGLTPLRVADSDALRQGQIVLAVGNPLSLENSVSMGVVSSVYRQLRPEDHNVYIQTDTPINPGNSGGPLVDIQGGMVGINTFILTESGSVGGIGFAIPSNMVKRIYTEIRKTGHAHHGVIGALSLTVTPSLAAGLNLPQDWGVILEDVERGGPGEKAGLQPGDFVTEVDGEIIRDKYQFLVAIDRHAIGETVKVEVLRGTQKVVTEVTVHERPDDPNRFMELVTEKANLIDRLGILAFNLNEQHLKMASGLRKPANIIVAARVAGPPTSEEGLNVGDLIICLNGKAIHNLEALRADLVRLPAGSPAVLQIQRESQLKYIVVDMP